MNPGKNIRKRAILLIILFGVLSLFADTIYEGARGVNGPYLAELGANATIVGLIAGTGEFIGYALRVISGYFSDRTKSYWLFTFIGYGMLLSVPLLALTGIWQVAAIFMVMERLGKALRSPSKDTILSMVSDSVGRGYGFGLHEAMDQLGAFIGPMLFTALFAYYAGNHLQSLAIYQKGYAILIIPFILVVASLVAARILVPHPEAFEKHDDTAEGKHDRFTKIFWLYTAFTFFTTAGFAVFTLIAYHLKVHSIVAESYIPVFYAGAMIIDGIAAVIVGWLYDRTGLRILVLLPILTAPVAFFVFSSKVALIIAGVALWGIVMGMHETIMKAAIADLTHINKRGMGYGIFNAAYGVSLLIGGTLMGYMYDGGHITQIAVFSIVMEIAAMLLFFSFFRREIINGEAGA